MKPSINHNIEFWGDGLYLIEWTSQYFDHQSGMIVDNEQSRWVDKASAERFSKKWGVPVPTRLVNLKRRMKESTALS